MLLTLDAVAGVVFFGVIPFLLLLFCFIVRFIIAFVVAIVAMF